MKIYPYSSPIIMNDDAFILYGGLVGNSLPAQRTAAYFIAEERMSGHLNTFLSPTVVTGSFAYSPTVLADYTYVNSVSLIQFVDTDEDVYYTISGTANTYASLRDAERGVVDVFAAAANCGCSHAAPYPYSVNMVYTAGLPTGISMHSNMVMGLTMMSQIVLNEIVGFGNESSGDIGVQSFSNQEYSEQRIKLGRSAFGTSAKAQFIKNLVRSLVRHRYIKL